MTRINARNRVLVIILMFVMIFTAVAMITPHKKPPNGELSETAKEANRSVNRIRRAERAHHRPHQVLKNPPHRLPPPPAHIRTDHHRRTLTLRIQNHPLNNLHCAGGDQRDPGRVAAQEP